MVQEATLTSWEASFLHASQRGSPVPTLKQTSCKACRDPQFWWKLCSRMCYNNLALFIHPLKRFFVQDLATNRTAIIATDTKLAANSMKCRPESIGKPPGPQIGQKNYKKRLNRTQNRQKSSNNK